MKILRSLKILIRKIFFPPDLNKLVVINHLDNKLLINKTTTAVKLKYGLYEKSEFDFLRRNIRPSDICLDVGANIGAYTIFFAKHTKKVLAFEPIKLNRAIIKFNAELNSLPNIELEKTALSDFDGENEFLVVNESILSGLVSYDLDNQIKYLKNTYNAFVKKIIKIQCKKLDSYNLEKFDILKIDVEGSELKVINGGIQTIKKCKPRLIMMECENDALKLFQNDLDEIIQKMISIDYQPLILKEGKLTTFDLNCDKQFENLFFKPIDH